MRECYSVFCNLPKTSREIGSGKELDLLWLEEESIVSIVAIVKWNGDVRAGSSVIQHAVTEQGNTRLALHFLHDENIRIQYGEDPSKVGIADCGIDIRIVQKIVARDADCILTVDW